jgi:hypothetical protein
MAMASSGAARSFRCFGSDQSSRIGTALPRYLEWVVLVDLC